MMRAGLAGDRRWNSLFEVHRMKPPPPRIETAGTVGEALEIPQVHEQPAATPGARLCQFGAALDILEAGLLEQPSRPKRLHRPVAFARGNQRHHGRAAAERDV